MIISTNILRDSADNLEYIVTPNAQRIYSEIENTLNGKTSTYSLIGSYGTGKSSFLIALESTLRNNVVYFDKRINPKSVGFVKIIGLHNSLRSALATSLKLKDDSEESIIEALKVLEDKKSPLVILIDEFGKFIEYSLEHNPNREIYFLQLLAEHVNSSPSTTLITTLHQNFSAYANSSDTDIAEWEKVSGRFLPLNFNEPPETLIRLASSEISKLNYDGPSIRHINSNIAKTRLIPEQFISTIKSCPTIAPFDALSAYVTISLLQKYGQNERSLFTFIGSDDNYGISQFRSSIYSLSALYNYSINRLGHVIYSSENPYKLQWESAERAMQRADYYEDLDHTIAHAIIKSILLINIFSKANGCFDREVASKYFKSIYGDKAVHVLERLEEQSIIQFLRRKNQLVFVEGTDLNLQYELLEANSRIPGNINLLEELNQLIQFPNVLAKRHFLRTGTPRFASYSFEDGSEKEVDQSTCNVLITINGSKSTKHRPDLTCRLNHSKVLEKSVRDLLKLQVVHAKFEEDFVVKRIIQGEFESELLSLKKELKRAMYRDSVWISAGRKVKISSEKDLNINVSQFFDKKYFSCPIVINELINKTKLSPSINSSRRILMNALLNRNSDKSLGFVENKFPPEKTITYSTLIKEGMYSFTTGTLRGPSKKSSYTPAWNYSIEFLESSRYSKRPLSELLEALARSPFGMKDGFIRYWIMFVLIVEENNFALFYKPEDRFLPFLSEEIIEAILRNPDQFQIKRYNFDRIPNSVVNTYERIVSNGDISSKNSKKSIFKIYAEFLSKAKGLPGFTKQTKQHLSKEAIRFRDAIMTATDPEQAIISGIPSAFGIEDISKVNKEDSERYSQQIRAAESELGNCYNELLERFYIRICTSLSLEPNTSLESVKKIVESKLKTLNLDVIEGRTKVVIQRLKSPLEDKGLWTKSVIDSIVGSNIENISDIEVSPALISIDDAIEGLIEASQLHSNKSKDGFMLRLADYDGSIKSRYIPFNGKDKKSNSKAKEIQRLANRLYNLINE